MKEEEQKIIAQMCFKRGFLTGVKECANVVFRDIGDPDLFRKVLLDFEALEIKLAKANVEVEVVDFREEQEKEKSDKIPLTADRKIPNEMSDKAEPEKEIVVKSTTGAECPHCSVIVPTHYKYCPHCGSLMLRRQK